MSDERVPQNGKADVAFAGAELGDAWLLIGSVFAALVFGSLFGWGAYIGIPLLGYFGTKAYIQWKSNNLPGHFTVLLYRWGLAGYSAAFNRKKKLFIGDSKVVNPGSLHLGAIVRAEAREHDAGAGALTSTDSAEPFVEDDESELVN
jgi:hypothetical protein